MLIRIPLPAFYVDATDDNRWLVVDGLQRLYTIKNFVIENSLRLKGLEFMHEYNGKRFSELPREMQRRIEETRIVVHLIKQGTPEAVRYEIFSRINTGGTPLNCQEIRHAMNSGHFTEALAKLARSEEFQEAIIKGVPSARMQDQECVLRFMAFTMFPPESYCEPNLDTFLQHAMEVGNMLTDEKIEELGKRFRRAMIIAHTIFGENAFRKYDTKQKSFNKALFETVSVNIGNLNDDQQRTLKERRTIVEAKMRTLLKDDREFAVSVSEGTGASAKIRYRFKAVKDMLQEILDF